MAERLRRYENQENQLDRMVAPCHSLILPLDELKSRYNKYYEYMLEVGMKGGPRAHPFMSTIRRDLKNKDYVREMKIPLHLSLDPIRLMNTFPHTGMPEIFVVSASGPHEFSLMRDRQELMDMEEQMKTFYEDRDSNYRDPQYVLATGVFEGSHYAVFSQRMKKWARCISGADAPVVRPESQIVVTLIDYGKREVVPANRIRPLLPSFCKLPAQGYFGRLADCYPVVGVITSSLCAQFNQRVVGKRFYIHVLDYKRGETHEQGHFVPPRAVACLITGMKQAICLSSEDGNRKLVEIEETSILKD